MQITTLRTTDVTPGSNDRKVFDAEALEELAASIERDGLAQPPTVRRLDDGAYQIVAGERRFRAMTEILGWAEIPAIVRELDDRAASAIMLAENLSRVDLDPVAEAEAYQSRMDALSLSAGEVAAMAGVSVARVVTRLPILRLVDEARQMVASGQLSLNHARSMADLDANRQRIALDGLARGLAYFEFVNLVNRLKVDQAAEQQDVFAWKIDELVADAREAQAAKSRSKNALIGALVAELEAAGLATDLVAEAKAALR